MNQGEIQHANTTEAMRYNYENIFKGETPLYKEINTIITLQWAILSLILLISAFNYNTLQSNVGKLLQKSKVNEKN